MLSSVAPKLPFIDKAETLKFYIEGLGFDLLSDYGDYLIIQKEGVELHFFAYPTLQPSRSDFMIYLRVDAAIESFYEDLIRRGVAIHPNGPLETKPWGQLEFALLDPNGTLLTLGQPA